MNERMISNKINRIFLFNEKVLSGCSQLEKAVIIFYCISMFESSWLAFNYPPYPIYQIILSVFRWGAFLVGGLYIFHTKKISKKNAFLCLIPLCYFGILVFQGDNGDSALAYLTQLTSIIVFLLLKDEIKRKIVLLFLKALIIMLPISILLYTLSIIGVYTYTVPYYSEVFASNYFYKFGPLAVLSSSGLLRLCGPFNEGGNLGTICALLYTIFEKRLNTNHKILLILSIALSFSVAGWILLILYSAFKLLMEEKFKGAIFFLVLVWIVLVVPSIDFGNTYINTFVQRFSFSSEGGLSGDNRTWWMFDEQYTTVVGSGLKYWGQGAGFEIVDNSSYKRYIILYGYCGFALMTIPWIIAAFKRSKKSISSYIFSLLFFISIYQRPTPLINLFGYMLLFGGLAYLQSLPIVRGE